MEVAGEREKEAPCPKQGASKTPPSKYQEFGQGLGGELI
jgi:hypothetical protein